MDRIGTGFSAKKEPIQATKEALTQALLHVKKEKVSLALLFTSIELFSQSMLNTISAYLGGAPVIGCSSQAIISNQGLSKHGLVIMVLSFPEGVYCNTAYVKDIKEKTALTAGEELGEKLLQGFQNMRRDLSLIFSDGLTRDTSFLIDGLQNRLGKSFPLAGASTSDSLHSLRTCVYFNQELLTDACAGILWGGKLNFALGIKHGWKPLGKPRLITRSKDNVIYTIDNEPAANIYEEYMSSDLETLGKELKRVSIFYPIGMHLAGEEEYLLRNILAIQEDGSLVVQGNVPEGTQIRLMIGTHESCLAATHQAASEAKKGLYNPMMDSKQRGQTKCVIVFDSISRYMLLGRRAYKELEIIKEEMGNDVPIIGLYSYGEQAPLSSIDYHGRAYFHNQTITIVALSM